MSKLNLVILTLCVTGVVIFLLVFPFYVSFSVILLSVLFFLYTDYKSQQSTLLGREHSHAGGLPAYQNIPKLLGAFWGKISSSMQKYYVGLINQSPGNTDLSVPSHSRSQFLSNSRKLNSSVRTIASLDENRPSSSSSFYRPNGNYSFDVGLSPINRLTDSNPATDFRNLRISDTSRPRTMESSFNMRTRNQSLTPVKSSLGDPCSSRKHQNGRGSPKNIQSIAGPLLASTRYNLSLDPVAYADVTSAGLASRLVKYATDHPATHQHQYSGPGQFPTVQLSKTSRLPMVTRSQVIGRSPVRIRIAPPEYSERRNYISPDPTQLHISSSSLSSRSSLDRLKEISRPDRLQDVPRKRLHAQLGETEDEAAKKQRVSDCSRQAAEDAATPKRGREESPKDDTKTKRTKNNEIFSSLSSSRHLTTGTNKRKQSLDEWSQSGTPMPVGKLAKKSLPSPETPSTSMEQVKTLASSQHMEMEATPLTSKTLVAQVDQAPALRAGPTPKSEERPVPTKMTAVPTKGLLYRPSSEVSGWVTAETFPESETTAREKAKLAGEDLKNQRELDAKRRLSSMMFIVGDKEQTGQKDLSTSSSFLSSSTPAPILSTSKATPTAFQDTSTPKTNDRHVHFADKLAEVKTFSPTWSDSTDGSTTQDSDKKKSEGFSFGSSPAVLNTLTSSRDAGKSSPASTTFSQSAPISSPAPAPPLTFGLKAADPSTTVAPTSSAPLSFAPQSVTSASGQSGTVLAASSKPTFGAVSPATFGGSNQTGSGFSGLGSFNTGKEKAPASGFSTPATVSAVSGFGSPATLSTSGGFSTPTAISAASGFGIPSTVASSGGFGTPTTVTAIGGFGTPSTVATSGGFGTPSTVASSGGFGTPSTLSASGGFGTPTTVSAIGGFGTPSTVTASGAFGTPSTLSVSGGFGTPTTVSASGGFVTPSTVATSGGFGTPSTLSASGGFGTPPTVPASGGFGTPTTVPASGGFGTPSTLSASGGFGIPSTVATSAGFGTPSTLSASGGFGMPSTVSASGGFGTPSTVSASGGFGTPSTVSASGGFGTPSTVSASGGFGTPSTLPASGGFGTPSTVSASGGFGTPSTLPASGGFGTPSTVSASGGFGTPSTVTASVGFGTPATTNTLFGFGAATTAQSQSVGFGSQTNPVQTGFGGFGTSTTQTATAFGGKPAAPGGFAFGGNTATAASSANTNSMFGAKTDKPPNFSLGNQNVASGGQAANMGSAQGFKIDFSQTGKQNAGGTVFGGASPANPMMGGFSFGDASKQAANTTQNAFQFGSNSAKPFSVGASNENSTQNTQFSNASSNAAPANTTQTTPNAFGQSVFGSQVQQQQASTFPTMAQQKPGGFSFGGGNAAAQQTANSFVFGGGGGGQSFGFGAATSQAPQAKPAGGFAFSAGSAPQTNQSNPFGQPSQPQVTTASPAFQFGSAPATSSGGFNFGGAATGAAPAFGAGASNNAFQMGSAPPQPQPQGQGMFSIGTGSAAPRARTARLMRRQR